MKNASLSSSNYSHVCFKLMCFHVRQQKILKREWQTVAIVVSQYRVRECFSNVNSTVFKLLAVLLVNARG